VARADRRQPNPLSGPTDPTRERRPEVNEMSRVTPHPFPVWGSFRFN
jgi:hypothetical protein